MLVCLPTVRVTNNPSVPKKKFHLWITLGITWDMSSCTSEEQVTLHIENCMECPHFHKWKFKWKFFEVLRDFTCSLYSFFVWPVTCRWHVPSESLGKIRILPWVFTCEITCKGHVPSESLGKIRIFPWVFNYKNIEFKIHTYLISF